MKTIYATNPVDVLHLGKQGEYGNTQVYFPATGLSDCTVIILNKRCGETYPYACTGEFVIKNGKHFFVWSVGSAETCKPGKGAVEINFYFDNILQKSATYTTYVSMSVENSEDYVPVAMQTWVGMMMQNTAQSLKYFTDCQKFYEDCKKLRDEIFTFDAGDESNDLVNTMNRVFTALNELESKTESIADKDYVDEALSAKADKAEMEQALDAKADKDYVENSLSAMQGKLNAGFGITISETNTISVSLGMAEGVGF